MGTHTSIHCTPTESDLGRARHPRSALRFSLRVATILAFSVIGLAAATFASDKPNQHVELIGGDPSADGVIEVQAPYYYAYHINRDGIEGSAVGVVTVEVEIDSTGAVIDASVLSHPGVPLLQPWAEAAAKHWRFEPSGGTWTRRRVLTFSFEGKRRAPKLAEVIARYESPLTLHIAYIEPSVLFLDRVDGKIPDTTCEVHDVPMTVELVPLGYGLPHGVDPDSSEGAAQERWWNAQAELFPNAPRRKLGGCIVSSETQVEVYICPACRAARDQWLEEHPEFDPLW